MTRPLNTIGPSVAPTRLQVLVVGTCLLFAGFGDGVGYAIADLTGQRSPWIFVLPALAVPLFIYLAARGPAALARTDTALLVAFAAFSGCIVAVEALVLGDFYVIGLLQLCAFLVTLVLVRSIFASAPEWLNAAFRRVITPIHFFLCGYVILAYAVVHVLCVDVSLLHALTGGGAQSSEYYGLRPSGFSREPQWTAIAIAASYIGVHYLVPSRGVLAFVALLASSALGASGTGFVFAGAIASEYAVRNLIWIARRHKGVGSTSARPRSAGVGTPGRRKYDPTVVRSGALVLAAALGLAVLARTPANACPQPPPPSTTVVLTVPSLSERPRATPIPETGAAQLPTTRLTNVVSGLDPSTNMRVTSAGVAWRVIEDSFPLGVGYGNYRRYAVYPSGFDAASNLSRDTNYKSDSFVLNYIAELGLLGALLIVWVGGLLVATRQFLPAVFVAFVAILSGTILIPAVLAMAAIVGLLVRDARQR